MRNKGLHVESFTHFVERLTNAKEVVRLDEVTIRSMDHHACGSSAQRFVQALTLRTLQQAKLDTVRHAKQAVVLVPPVKRRQHDLHQHQQDSSVAYQTVEDNGVASHDVSKVVRCVQESLALLMYAASGVDSGDYVGMHAKAEELAISALLTLSELAEGHTALSKGLLAVEAWKFCWTRVEVALHYQEKSCHTQQQTIAWGFRVLANFAAGSEKLILNQLLDAGALDAAARIVSESAEAPPQNRESIKQALRFLGNCCFGSAVHSSQCGPQQCKLHLHQLAEQHDDKHIPSWLIAVSRLIRRSASLMLEANEKNESIFWEDASVLRWAMHAVNEYVYGGAPNRQQGLALHASVGIPQALVELLTFFLLPKLTGALLSKDEMVCSNDHLLRLLVLSKVASTSLLNCLFRMPLTREDHGALCDSLTGSLQTQIAAVVTYVDQSGAAARTTAVSAECKQAIKGMTSLLKTIAVAVGV